MSDPYTKMMPKILLRRPKADSSQNLLRHPREGEFVPSLEKLKGTWLLVTFPEAQSCEERESFLVSRGNKSFSDEGDQKIQRRGYHQVLSWGVGSHAKVC